MKESSKKALNAVGCAVSALIFGGGGLFVFVLFALLSGFPLYGVQSIAFAVVAILIAAVVDNSGYVTGRGKRWLATILAFAVVGAALFAGFGYYKDNLPTVDDRDLLLYEYEPFAEGTKAVSLDEPANLQLSKEQLSKGQLPRLDGATALYPVYASFVQAVYPEGEYRMYDNSQDGYAMVTCSNTVNAYQRLIEGKTDIVFAAGPSKAQKEEAQRKGIQLHLTPIGREAFVFFVNSKNPVSELTVEEIQAIYSGQITNWKQLGGRNWDIRPFQRAENSGSQTALQRLMGDLPLIEPEEEERVSAMDGIIRQVASYRNYKNAIGFSFRYYATEMVTSNEIRLLALNGVEPTRETISDGTYPISSEFYAVTASPVGQPSPQEKNETIAALLDWILSPQGQSIVEKSGYVPL